MCLNVTDSPDQLVGSSRRDMRTSSDTNRLSVATLDSMLTTGETVYEDAWEEFEAEDDDAFDEPALPRRSPPLQPILSTN